MGGADVEAKTVLPRMRDHARSVCASSGGLSPAHRPALAKTRTSVKQRRNASTYAQLQSTVCHEGRLEIIHSNTHAGQHAPCVESLALSQIMTANILSTELANIIQDSKKKNAELRTVSLTVS